MRITECSTSGSEDGGSTSKEMRVRKITKFEVRVDVGFAGELQANKPLLIRHLCGTMTEKKTQDPVVLS